MLKDYLNKNQISIYTLSKNTNIPYTTLNELVNGKKKISDCKLKTIENLAKGLNLSIESLLSILNADKILLSSSWEDNKNKKFYFPVLIQNTNYQCNRIHPLMQKKIFEIYELIKNQQAIKKVILFGSSINIRCNQKSDIDLAILLKNEFFNQQNQNTISEEIQEITKYNCDIVWLNNLDSKSRLYENIITKGVIIYE